MGLPCCWNLLRLTAGDVCCLQAEAAAQHAEYRSQLQLVLSSMGKSGKVADDAQLLYRLADQLFASPLNVLELIEQGGVSVLHKAADRALQELSREHCDSAALTLLLQVRRAGSPAKRRHDILTS